MNKIDFKWPNGLTLNMLIIAILSIAVTTSSCKKDEDDDPPATSSNSSNDSPPTPQPADGKGTLVAARGTTTQTVPGVGEIDIPFNTAIAIFYDDATNPTFKNAGTVSCEGEALTIQSTKEYVYYPSQTNPSGITFDGDLDWEVSGAGNVPTISESISLSFPSVGSITSDSLIDRTKDYTLTCNFVSDADSIIWIVGGLFHVTASNATSSTFTAAELGTLAKGQSIAQVVGYNITSTTTSGEKYYYVTEDIRNRLIGLD